MLHDVMYVTLHDVTYVMLHDVMYVMLHDATYVMSHDATYVSFCMWHYLCDHIGDILCLIVILINFKRFAYSYILDFFREGK